MSAATLRHNNLALSSTGTNIMSGSRFERIPENWGDDVTIDVYAAAEVKEDIKMEMTVGELTVIEKSVVPVMVADGRLNEDDLICDSIEASAGDQIAIFADNANAAAKDIYVRLVFNIGALDELS